MEKEEAINEFLKGLRIVLNNASAYFKEHPYFIKSVKDFKQKVDQLFNFLSPIRIDITPHSLFIEGRHWEKQALYVELASMFHLRKIKGVEFRAGLTVEELVNFLSSVSLPIKEILRQGGLQNILDKEKNEHIHVEELDYSQFLKGEGEEAKDIWVYLFRKSVEKQDLDKINEFADNFEEIIKKFKASDILQDGELRENLYNFLSYLKAAQKDKFSNCTKDLLRLVLKDEGVLREEKLDEIRLFFKDLEIKDLTQELWNGIVEDDKFNALNLAVFSRLMPEDTHKSIAIGLQEKTNMKEALNISPLKRKKIKELLFSNESPFISNFYRNVLTSLSRESAISEGFSFEQEGVNKHYRLVLLNLLTQEKNKEYLNLISQCLVKECANAILEKNFEYLKYLLGAVNKKIKDDPYLSGSLTDLEKNISNFIENEVFENDSISDSDYFIDALKISALGADFYLDKIFNQKKVNPSVLKLWFKLFSDKMYLFYDNLKEKSYDLELMSKIINGLKATDSSLSIEALKKTFFFTNNIMKAEVLKAMQNLKYRDNEFLFSILNNEDVFLKKEALLILAKDEIGVSKALEKLFSVSGMWWSRNKIILENIMLVSDIGLKEASGYLVTFSKMKFVWNKKIREKAQEVLKKWNG